MSAAAASAPVIKAVAPTKSSSSNPTSGLSIGTGPTATATGTPHMTTTNPMATTSTPRQRASSNTNANLPLSIPQPPSAHNLKSSIPIPLTNVPSATPATAPAPIVTTPPPPASPLLEDIPGRKLAPATSTHPRTGSTFASSCPSQNDASSDEFEDRRIKNPIKSRMKVTEKKLFNVMNFGLRHRTDAKDRDAMAKRTSESTVLAAKRAEAEGYRPVRRKTSFFPSQHIRSRSSVSHVTPDTMNSQSTSIPVQSPSPNSTSSIPAQVPLASPHPAEQPLSAPPPAPLTSQPVPPPVTQPAVADGVAGAEAMRYPRITRPHVRRAGPLTPEEAKEEQSRILNLFQTLGPNTISDRVRKAIEFFGRTTDLSEFPESEEGNGVGSLFIGWMSEIFPPLDPNQPRPRGGVVVNGVVRRPRGRPRGSKTKNYGITALKRAKRQGKVAKTAVGVNMNDGEEHENIDDSWVDVDEGALGPGSMGVEEDNIETLEFNAPVSSSNQTSGFDPLVEVQAALAEDERPPVAPPAASQPHPTANTMQATHAPPSSGRRRGRPKGSKNKPKPEAPTGPEASAGTNSLQPANPSARISTQPSTPQKHGPGRPKGSKNKPKPNPYPTEKETSTPILQSSSQDIESRRPLPSFSPQDVNGSHTPKLSNAAASSAGAQKRKRGSKTGTDPSTSNVVTSGAGSQTPNIQPSADHHSLKRQRTGQGAAGGVLSAPDITSSSFNMSDGMSETLQDSVQTLAFATTDSFGNNGHAQLSREDAMHRAASSTGQQQQQQQQQQALVRSLQPSSPSLSQSIPRTQQQLATAFAATPQGAIAAARSSSGFFQNRNIFTTSQLSSQYAQQQQRQSGNGLSNAAHSSPQFNAATIPSENTAFNRMSGIKHNMNAYQTNARRVTQQQPSIMTASSSLDPGSVAAYNNRAATGTPTQIPSSGGGSGSTASPVGTGNSHQGHHQNQQQQPNTYPQQNMATSASAPTSMSQQSNFPSFGDHGGFLNIGIETMASTNPYGSIGGTIPGVNGGSTNSGVAGGSQRGTEPTNPYEIWRGSQG